MKHNILKAMDFLNSRRKEKVKKETIGTKERVNDLFVKFYSYKGKIDIPIPTLWALAKIDEFFGSQDKINFNNINHIGKLLYILYNQHNNEAIHFTRQQIDKKIHEILNDIPANLKESYQQALYEMFLALKKNSIHRTKDILERIRNELPTG